MRSRVAPLVAAAAALCIGCAPASMGRAAQGIDPGARVGERPLEFPEAVAAFETICLDHAPRYEGSAAEARRLGLVRKTKNLFLHPALSLSVRIWPGVNVAACSVAAGSVENGFGMMLGGVATGVRAAELGVVVVGDPPLPLAELLDGQPARLFRFTAITGCRADGPPGIMLGEGDWDSYCFPPQDDALAPGAAQGR